MAAQQTLIAETIRGMKLALRRRDDASDSDTSIHQHTNRGNKLKRNAAHVREGRLDNTGGRSYRRKIDHAGYQRFIIHDNPPRVDEDGDIIEGEDDEEEGNGSPDEDNPFNGTKLEDLLAPLTSAAELANHPSLSIPFTAKSLTEMADNARDMLHRERETLWQMKQLLQRLRGDEMWAPLEKLETVHDDLLLDADAADEDSVNYSNITGGIAMQESMDLDAPRMSKRPNGMEQDLAGISAHTGRQNGVHTIDMALGHGNGLRAEHTPQGTNGVAEKIKVMDGFAQDPKILQDTDGDQTMTNGDEKQGHFTDSLNRDSGNARDKNELDGNDVDPGAMRKSIEADSPAASVSGQPQHRMTTRAKARTPPSPDANASPSASPAPSSIPSINNFFLAPFTSVADRDFGLPGPEAEETRRLLVMYVQKQEETVRCSEDLLMGLLRADRARKEVWAWCRAEGHVGEMSDGEDWIDKDEWGLEADLVKGKEEEDVEEDTGRKVSRRRRAEGKNKVVA